LEKKSRKRWEILILSSKRYLYSASDFNEIQTHYFKQLNITCKEDLEKYSEIDISLNDKMLKGFFSSMIKFNRDIGFVEYSPKVFRNILMLDSINYDELFK
jgi:hypothetical protein